MARRLAAVTVLSAYGWQDISRLEVSMTSKCQVFLRRLLKADADAQQYIDMAAQLLECIIAADVAAKIQQMLQPKFSNQTV